MSMLADVKITGDVAKPLVHTPADELHVKIFHPVGQCEQI